MSEEFPLPSSSVTASLLAEVLAHYDPALTYHHAGHALAVRDQALVLARSLAEAGRVVDLEVVELSALFHDAGYLGAPTGQTREAYAAAIAAASLTAHHYPSRVIETVKRAILDTEHDAYPSTLEGQVLRISDLAQMAAPYAVFAPNSEALRLEVGILGGAVPSEVEWRGKVRAILEFFLDHDGTLAASLFGDDRWSDGTRANLDRYVSGC